MASVYRKAYCDEIVAYFSEMRRSEDDKILGVPSFLSFAKDHGISITQLEKWRREHPDFDAAAEHAVEILRQLLMDAALNGTVNVTAAKFILSTEFGMLSGSGHSRSGKPEDGISEADLRLLRNLEERLVGISEDT